MLTKKLTSLGLTMAMTASLSLLAGCPAPTTTEPSASSSASVAPSADPSASVAPSASASAMPSATASASTAPSASGSTSPSGSASATPVANSSTTPTDTTGVTTDIKEKATFNGTIYDTNDVPVDGAKVTATSIDPSVTWKGEDQITAGGAYVFRNAPVGVRVLITVSKDGWTTRTQTQVLKSNLTGNPDANKFDFMNKDAIQDEPEVTGLKINDKVVTGAGKILDGSMFTLSMMDMGESEQRPASNTSANLSAVDSSNLKFEFAFSEAVDKEDFENAFVIHSQYFEREDYPSKGFTTDIDSGLNEMTFDWSSDRKSVTVKTNKPVLSQKTGDEARYNLYLPNNGLTDDTGKNAFSHNSDNSQGVIRFASKTTSDNIVFSVKNDTDGPMLLGLTAKSGGGSNDEVELRFSEPLEVAQFTSPTASLNIYGYGFTYNWLGEGDAVALASDDGDSDIIGLSQVQEIGTTGNFERVSFGRFGLEKVKVEGSKVLIELSPGNLVTGKKLVASIGRSPKVSGLSYDSGNFVQLKDPAGNDIESGNTSTSAKIEVSGVQRATTVN